MAKEVASVDVLSDGRFVFGVGYGWNVDEMEDHGVDPKRRRALVREKVLAMKALWTQDEAGFDGESGSIRAELVLAETPPAAAAADLPWRSSPGPPCSATSSNGPMDGCPSAAPG